MNEKLIEMLEKAEPGTRFEVSESPKLVLNEDGTVSTVDVKGLLKLNNF